MDRKANIFDRVLALLMILVMVFSQGNITVFAEEIAEAIQDAQTVEDIISDQEEVIPDLVEEQTAPADVSEPDVPDTDLIDQATVEADDSNIDETEDQSGSELNVSEVSEEATENSEEPSETSEDDANAPESGNQDDSEENQSEEQSDVSEEEKNTDNNEESGSDGEQDSDDESDETEEAEGSEDSDNAEEDNAEEVEEILYSAKSFHSASAVGIVVDVDAPEGAFPDGTEMVVVPVYDKAILDAAAEAVGDSSARVVAVDITFRFDGEEKEPLVPINVKLTSSKIAQADEAKIVHVDDALEATVIEKADIGETTAEFSSEDFSVYAVVSTVTPRLTVTFKKGTTTIASMIIKEADSAEEVEKIIYDPGVGTLNDGQMFKGWTTESEYTSSSALKSIVDVRQVAMSTVAGLTEDSEVTYYAAIFEAHTITYLSDDDEPITLGTAAVIYPSYSETKEGLYTVNMGYTVDSSHNFEGWLVNDTTNANIVNYRATDPKTSYRDTKLPELLSHLKTVW